MKLWESIIYLSALRKGYDEPGAQSLVQRLGGYTKQMLRTMGFSHDRINKEYSDEMLAHDTHLAKNDHKEFDRLIRKSEKWFLSRN